MVVVCHLPVAPRRASTGASPVQAPELNVLCTPDVVGPHVVPSDGLTPLSAAVTPDVEGQDRWKAIRDKELECALQSEETQPISPMAALDQPKLDFPLCPGEDPDQVEDEELLHKIFEFLQSSEFHEPIEEFLSCNSPLEADQAFVDLVHQRITRLRESLGVSRSRFRAVCENAVWEPHQDCAALAHCLMILDSAKTRPETN
mmetsp:Transcript_67396/g.158960  ORF Transcript_67396/g.158960 Transcript_67396/m.158960 type:complete len:202 (-) Transcript_67396:219-824(-)